jgi:predicted nucleic acid-binding protein
MLSFATMRYLGISEAFTLDRDFSRQGFRRRPS